MNPLTLVQQYRANSLCQGKQLSTVALTGLAECHLCSAPALLAGGKHRKLAAQSD
jgi:hypothetical protein